jgi:hypothetical protein
MATLRHLGTGAEAAVRRSSLVGRAPHAHVKLSAAGASNEHASLRWLGTEWILRDLNSRNGTRVNDQLLGGREWSLVRNDIIVFGDPAESWHWVEGTPPPLRAIDENGRVQESEGKLLTISDERGPQASIYLVEGHWELDHDGITRPVGKDEVVTVGGRRYALELYDQSSALDRTLGIDPGRRISEARIDFRVSQDEESVELSLALGGTVCAIPSRAANYMLLCLARLRQADHEAGLPDAESGWIYTNELAERLGESPEKVNVDIHRIRHALEKLRFCDDVENIVERRRSSGQLRLGIGKITVIRAGVAGSKPQGS